MGIINSFMTSIHFDQDVAISENVALKACLDSPDGLISKISQAKRKCFGGDSEFDWNDFADLNEVSKPRLYPFSCKV